ncbi:MAG: DUF4270 domain-containing protein [Bacteroidetes bacterium]|nr:DUF4270 domain-containing protein [Bacteroidota bacterium]
MRFSISLLLILITASTLWYACKKDVILDSSILPGGLAISSEFTDTTTIISYTIREDSLRTSSLTKHLLGAYQDPQFGKAIASINAQFRLKTNDIDLGSGSTFDSAVLMLDYAGFYGDITVPISVKLYELDETLGDAGDQQYSNRVFNIKPVEIGSKLNFIPNLNDTIVINGKTHAAHLRIRMDDSFAKNIFDESGDSEGALADNSNFENFFHGLRIAPDTTKLGASILYFHLRTSLTKLVFYYHDKDNDAQEFSVVINDDAAVVNTFSHNYHSGTDVYEYLNSPNKIQGEDSIFIQSMAGLKIKLKFPFFRNILSTYKSVGINKAELVVTVLEDDASDTYKSPLRLTCLRIADDGTNDFIPDQFEGDDYFGGTRKTMTDINGVTITVYKINLARHFQEIINDNEYHNGLYILSFPSPEIADRVLLAGNKNSRWPIKLNLTYTPVIK